MEGREKNIFSMYLFFSPRNKNCRDSTMTGLSSSENCFLFGVFMDNEIFCGQIYKNTISEVQGTFEQTIGKHSSP